MINREVKSFKEKNRFLFEKGLNSQWGSIRSIARQSVSKEMLMDRLFDDRDGYLKHGVAQKKWGDNRELLKKHLQMIPKDLILDYTEKLAEQMQKNKEL